MIESEFDEFSGILEVTSEQYGKKLSDGVVMLYWQALQGYDLPAVRDAIGRHLRNTDTGQYMPKIADIMRMMQGSSQDSALSAWSKVDRTLRQVGPYETVVFDDPLIHRVLHDMGGWLALGTKTDDEWPFVAKEFENRYRGFKSRNERVEYPAKLIGLFEASNATDGHKIAKPMMIGDAQKAQDVLRLGSSGGSLLSVTRLQDAALKLVKKDD